MTEQKKASPRYRRKRMFFRQRYIDQTFLIVNVLTMADIQVEMARTRPTSLATVGTTAASKAEARKLQQLVDQREQLEEQLRQLESEILTMVKIFFQCRIRHKLLMSDTLTRKPNNAVNSAFWELERNV